MTTVRVTENSCVLHDDICMKSMPCADACCCAVCHWCGDSDCGEVFLCDICEKAFCTKCIKSFLGDDTLANVLSSDPWSCFSCDASALSELTAQFTVDQEIDHFPADIEDTLKLLVFVENEFKMWDMKVTDESDDTLNEIRTEYQSITEGEV